MSLKILLQKKRKLFIYLGVILAATAIILVVIKYISSRDSYVEMPIEEEKVALLYGIPFESYTLDEGIIGNGQTISTIFAKYGVGASTVDAIARKAEGVFSLRNIRAGHNYTVFLEPDSVKKLIHFVYEQSVTDYLVISLEGDSVDVRLEQKEVTVKRSKKTATIESSLWNCMIDNGMTPALAMDLSDVYAWSIDFFGLQKGDSFTVIYDERYVDTLSIGAGKIWGAVFNHGGKEYYAVPFPQDGKVSFWDENGASLRKNLLKAPLKYSRISSKFSNSRLHPILKIRRPHHGVDYSAPAGTPVVAVSDGSVIYKGYSGGGGNTVKIKHNTNLTSVYMHLQKYGNISNGSRVRQGDVIGYVGSTGLSTGPHLDFRLYSGGTPIDPLKVPSEPMEPISKDNMNVFKIIKERIINELKGDVADSLKVTGFDLLTPEKADSTVQQGDSTLIKK